MVPDSAEWIYFKSPDNPNIWDTYQQIELAMLPNIVDWLKQNCDNRWRFYWAERYLIEFYSDEDYILFTLTWA